MVEDVYRTLDIFRSAFRAHGLFAAWENVVGLVVQPAVEFGDTRVFDYDHQKVHALSAELPASPALVYEAHSTDYQAPRRSSRNGGGPFCNLEGRPLAYVRLSGSDFCSERHRTRDAWPQA